MEPGLLEQARLRPQEAIFEKPPVKSVALTILNTALPTLTGNIPAKCKGNGYKAWISSKSEDDMKGLRHPALNKLSANRGDEAMIQAVGNRMNLSQTSLLSEEAFINAAVQERILLKQQPDEKGTARASEEEILNYIKVNDRYSRKETEDFIQGHMKGGSMEVDETPP